MALNMWKEKWTTLSSNFLPWNIYSSCGFFKIHFTFLFWKKLFSSLKKSSLHNILILYASSTPTSNLETRISYVSLELTCIIGTLGIMSDTGPGELIELAFKRTWAKQIYSLTQKF